MSWAAPFWACNHTLTTLPVKKPSFDLFQANYKSK